MIRVSARVRSLVRVVAICSAAGAVLASCATSTVTSPHVTGLPAISISVPLSSVGCTTDGSCVALGTSFFDVSPTSVGEYRMSSGRWAALPVPSANPSTTITSSSCWNEGCLFVGSQSSGDLVWRYDAGPHAVRAETAPTGASGISAVSCYASMACAILDSSKGGPRFLTTDDGGITWSLPVTFGVPSQDFVSALSCSSTLTCMASFQSSSNGIAVYVTDDGGATWSPRTGFSTVTWSVLTSLNCARKECLGLAKLSTGWRIVRTVNFGRSWTKVASLHGSILTLACSSLERCVVGGTKSFLSSSPWLATVTSGSVRAVKLTYVPSPISDVACAANLCAAIGVTTVLTLRP